MLAEEDRRMNRVSPKLTTVTYFAELPWLVIAGAVFAALGAWVWPWLWLGVAFFAVILAWALWVIPARVRRIGWRETADELLITKGRIWRTLTVVPYGRIQFVDVTAGPIERSLGMKTLELHTASASSDSSVQGLPADTADALRDRLAVKARERMSGL